MRYNENNGEEINGQIVISESIEADSIFENSCIVIVNVKASKIRANYDLRIIGNVEVDTLDVAGSFSCIGNCKVENMTIQGECLVDGNLIVQSGFVGGELTAKEICAEDLEVKGSICCANLECNGDVKCDKTVLTAEGLMGGGSLESKLALCGEYSMLDNSENIIVADMLEESYKQSESNNIKNTSITIDFEEWKDKERRFSTSKFYDELCVFAGDNEELKAECSAYKKLLVMDNIVIPPSLKVYVDMMDLFSRKFQIVSKTKLYARVKVKFQSWDYDDINHSKMSKLSQKEFVKMLNILTFKANLFNERIRQLILETLFITIGLDYDDVCKALEET